ncbi:MAG: RES family NAD+ phosphorylase [bacterium]|nr:RES family NAD+ phosphorylase [bacterium]
MMRVFRLCLGRWAATAFSGEGAVRYSGRWHFAGTPVVYTATTRSLAALETLVHLEIRHAPPGFVLIPAEVPGELIADLEDPPPGWAALPPGDVSRRAGNAWLESRRSVALRVPSIVVKGEHNVLLNPLHPELGRVEIGEPEAFGFDPRLAGGGSITGSVEKSQEAVEIGLNRLPGFRQPVQEASDPCPLQLEAIEVAEEVPEAQELPQGMDRLGTQHGRPDAWQVQGHILQQLAVPRRTGR